MFGFGWGALPHRPPGFWLRGAKPPQTCNGKHIQFISIECKLMLHVISEASVLTCSSHNSRNMSPIRSIYRVFPFPISKHPWKVIIILFYVHFSMLQTHANSEEFALFFSIGSLKKYENRTKITKNSQIFQIFQFCSTLGVFQSNLRQLGGLFGLSRGVLEASWGVLEASWRHIGGILDASWDILGREYLITKESHTFEIKAKADNLQAGRCK